jgi:oxalate decarboxylase/phosphoglucose isomerase-like protein (cupin superfamily)
MVDLSEYAGFQLKLDDLKDRFIFDDNVTYQDECYVGLNEILPVLLNKFVRYPERVYKLHRNVVPRAVDATVDTTSDLSYDIYQIPVGLLGIEFVKTHVYYAPCCEGKFSSIIECLSGELTVIMQKNMKKEDEYQFDTYVEDIIVVTIKRGEKLAIPAGYFYTFVNAGNTGVVMAKLSGKTECQVDYNSLRREKGLAYFIISKNAKAETVANPKYKMQCKLKVYTVKKICRDEALKQVFVPFDISTPLFNLHFISKSVHAYF